MVPAAAFVAGVGAWLFFGWFGLHTMFFDRTVDEAAPVFTVAESTVPETTAPETTTPGPATSGPGATGPGTTTTASPEDTAPETTAVPIVLAEGSFVDRSHPTSGTALILGDGAGTRVLRLEGFQTDNGPDLFVYLSTAGPDDPAELFDEDFVDLGVLKGNVGDQNYEIPAGIDLDHYESVVIWCRRFKVAFGAAALRN
jgi:hypothetical protein